MFFRQAGIFHVDYAADRALFPIPADRWMVGTLLALAATAPLFMNTLYLSSYLLPWLVWTAGALGLNLVLGWAGQFHLGYAAVMGIGAYAAVHGVRAGIPWELAVVLGGLTASVIGIGFAFAALRVKGLYLALSTLALQFVMDWVISHVPAISGGTQATLQAPDIRLLGVPVTSDAGLYYVALVWCLLVTVFMLNLRRTALGRALVAVREKDYAAAVIGVNSFYYKLVAFSTSSFIAGVTGAVLVNTFYHAVTPEQFSVDVSIQALAMVILSEDFHHPGVPGDGSGADRPAVGAVRQAGDGGAAHARADRQSVAAVDVAGTDGCARRVDCGRPAAAGRRQLCAHRRLGDCDLRDLRSEPAFSDVGRRPRLVRPRRLFRARRLRGGVSRQDGRAADDRLLAAGPGARACRRRPVRIFRGSIVGRVFRDADAGVRADRMVDRVPMGRGDRRRQRHPGGLAGAMGGKPVAFLLARDRHRRAGGGDAQGHRVLAVRLCAAGHAGFAAAQRGDRN